MWARASGGGADEDASRSSGRFRETSAVPLFAVINFVRNYGAYPDSRRFEAMPMISDSVPVWNVRFLRNCDSAVGT